MKINNRLETIGNLVEANSFCLDVGCDHGLLDIYLVKRKDNIKAIASDIAEGPLEQAKKNIKQQRLDKEIEVRLGSGLSTYSEGIDTVIISGMGGRNMIGICKENQKIMKQIKTFILSPNNYQEDVKRFFTHNGFYIENEEFVKDSNFIYQILIFKQGKKRYSRKEYFFGPIFLQKKGPLFKEYFMRELKSREILLAVLPKNFYLKRFQMKRQIKWIKEELQG